MISFQVCVANRYKLNKKYRKLKLKSDDNPDDLTLKTQTSQAQVVLFCCLIDFVKITLLKFIQNLSGINNKSFSYFLIKKSNLLFLPKQNNLKLFLVGC